MIGDAEPLRPPQREGDASPRPVVGTAAVAGPPPIDVFACALSSAASTLVRGEARCALASTSASMPIPSSSSTSAGADARRRCPASTAASQRATADLSARSRWVCAMKAATFAAIASLSAAPWICPRSRGVPTASRRSRADAAATAGAPDASRSGAGVASVPVPVEVSAAPARGAELSAREHPMSAAHVRPAAPWNKLRLVQSIPASDYPISSRAGHTREAPRGGGASAFRDGMSCGRLATRRQCGPCSEDRFVSRSRLRLRSSM